MAKIDRKKIHDKFDGKCAYCGHDLKGKFQVDHIIPQTVFVHRIKNKLWVPDFLSHLGENDVDHPDNLMPSCASCNNYKTWMDLHLFRENISELVARLNKRFNQYKIAKRFGLVEETKISVKFYFETVQSGD